jgi:hypothetical protein
MAFSRAGQITGSKNGMSTGNPTMSLVIEEERRKVDKAIAHKPNRSS